MSLIRKLAVVIVALASVSVARADLIEVINFMDDGSFTATSFSDGGVTVFGSNTINVSSTAGLGIVGGYLDKEVDSTGSEWIEFVANGSDEFAEFIIRGVGFGSEGFGDLVPSSIHIEFFSSIGASLGFIAGDPFIVSWTGANLLGLAGISGKADRIRFTAVDNFQFNIAEIGINGELDPDPPTTVPEPSTLGLLGIGLFALVIIRRKQVLVRDI